MEEKMVLSPAVTARAHTRELVPALAPPSAALPACPPGRGRRPAPSRFLPFPPEPHLETEDTGRIPPLSSVSPGMGPSCPLSIFRFPCSRHFFPAHLPFH